MGDDRRPRRVCGRWHVLALGTTLAISASIARAGAPRPLEPSAELRRYAEDVARFSAGDGEVASDAQAPDSSHFRRIIDELSGWPRANARLLARNAVVMHACASWLATLRGHFATAERHAERVEKLLPLAAVALDAPPAERAAASALRRDARVARGHDLLRRWQPSRALTAFEAVLADDPDDPDALLGAGMAEELRATRPALALERYVDAAAPFEGRKPAAKGRPPSAKRQERDRDASLSAAEALLRRASARAPVRDEARLHLGSVLLALSRGDEAVREWRAVLAGDPAPEDAALARLLLGRAAEQRQDWPAAAEQFRLALDATPAAQSASLGLSHALERLQDRAGARAVLQAALAGELDPAARDADPWVQYLYPSARRQKALMDALVASLR